MEGEAQELSDELRIRAFAVPGALAIALLFHSFALGQFLQRAFFSMWLHELGHATAAWLCGRPSFPGPWFTPVAAERSAVFAGLVSLGLAWGIWRFRGSNRLRWLFGSVLVVQLGCTLLLTPSAVERFILFAGDGGALFFGTLLMASIFVPRGSLLHRGWLRWGLLAIGAATFVDVFSLWWGALTDLELIPFGQNEGGRLSDPSRLAEEYGWTPRQLVNRYVGLAVTCLVALAGVKVIALLRARAAAR